MPTKNDKQPLPLIVGHHANEPARRGEFLFVTVTRSALREAIADARRALAGDSNDEEHDALSTLEKQLIGWEAAPTSAGDGPDDLEREIGAMVLGMATRRGLQAAQRDRFVAALEYTSLGELISDCVGGLGETEDGETRDED